MFCTLPRLPTRSTNVPSRPLLHHIVKLNKQLALLASYSILEWKAKTQPGRTLDCFYCFPRQSNWHTLGNSCFEISSSARAYVRLNHENTKGILNDMTKKNPKRMSSLQIPITWGVCLFTTYIDHYILELTKQLAVCSFSFRAQGMQKFKIFFKVCEYVMEHKNYLTFQIQTQLCFVIRPRKCVNKFCKFCKIKE